MKRALIIPALAIFSAFALMVGAVMNVNAGHHEHSMFSADLTDMDTNADGVVSFEEYSAYHTERLEWSFNALDTDNDGYISNSEWDTFLKMHGVDKNYHHNQQG